MSRARHLRTGAIGALALLLVAGTAQGASAMPGVRAEATDGCEPTALEQFFGIDGCDDPATPEPTGEPTASPDPEATPTPAPTDAPATPDSGEPDAEPEASPAPKPAAPKTPVLAPLDEGAPVFTGDPATLSGDTLAIEGLSGLAIVSVRLADGSTERAIRLKADRIVIDGFRLDVPAGDGGLRNTATTLTVDGNVVVYTPSITGILEDGTKRLIDTLTTPTADELAGLTRLTLPLRGMVADSIVYDDSHQATF
ncbi:hypothetical protein MUN74_14775 [Agromyces endophyticus]|uniref:hypothetical protein n=1 Tax=Agromyces sp. H17E-10 TaxID=2932244 RepID=UPI001FD32F9F|nr:hypothetical protein [Agromyces sp. H17E-10]UOQ88524.1 hypothetical protein MUN74_14775 [Agromyces sp. H17E-10]